MLPRLVVAEHGGCGAYLRLPRAWEAHKLQLSQAEKAEKDDKAKVEDAEKEKKAPCRFNVMSR